MEPELNKEQAEAAIEAKTAPRITLDGIKSKIGNAEFHKLGDTLTVCVITMVNGFTVVGKSACASPENYDKAIGERISYDDAYKQLWALEGYLLREKLYWAAKNVNTQAA